jgi:prevent-host-death family protein
MRTIGIRELRQNASHYLRMVRDGESIEITDRGEPIAMITPIRKNETSRERLIREGRLIPAEDPTRGFDDIVPVKRRPGEPSLSQLIIEERESDWR